MDSITEAISLAVRKVQQEKKWSLRRLAAECDISYAHMRRLRDGEIADPGIDMILRLAQVGTLSLDRTFALETAERLQLELSGGHEHKEILARFARLESKLDAVSELVAELAQGAAGDGSGAGRVRRKLIRGFLKYLEEFRDEGDEGADGRKVAG
jgi:transcriptional regulator with XRE-family HTH domain